MIDFVVGDLLSVASIDSTAVLPAFMTPSTFLQLLAFAILLGGIYGLVALGLTMIFGVMDVINFAHGALMVVAMYIVWWASTTFAVSPFIIIPIAVVSLFVLGIVIHLVTIAPIMEAPQENQLIVTFGVLLLLVHTIEIMFTADHQTLDMRLSSIPIGGVYLPGGQLFALVVAIAAVIVFWVFLQRTQLGRAIRGTADDRNAAQYVGINVPRVDYLTFGLGAALAGLAGAIIPFFQAIDPHLGDAYLINAFVIVVLGGLGSFPGALVGGMIIGFVHVFGLYFLPGAGYQMAIFVIFILVLLFQPQGIFGEGGHA